MLSIRRDTRKMRHCCILQNVGVMSALRLLWRSEVGRKMVFSAHPPFFQFSVEINTRHFSDSLFWPAHTCPIMIQRRLKRFSSPQHLSHLSLSSCPPPIPPILLLPTQLLLVPKRLLVMLFAPTHAAMVLVPALEMSLFDGLVPLCCPRPHSSSFQSRCAMRE